MCREVVVAQWGYSSGIFLEMLTEPISLAELVTTFSCHLYGFMFLIFVFGLPRTYTNEKHQVKEPRMSA
jgi:hypothetical protein